MITHAVRTLGRLTLLWSVGALADTNEPIRRLSAPSSGYVFQSADTQSLQDDDFSNPAFLLLERGEHLFTEGVRSCQSCHGDIESLRGVSTRYPAFEPRLNHLVNLEQRINLCQIEHQQQRPWRYESERLLALTLAVAHQSRGMPFSASINGPARPYFDQAREYYYQRRGQLNLSCAHCHEQNYGRMLRGDRLSQGHSNGYPIYRLTWQGVGSLHRRLRFCNEGVRANVLPYGDERYVALELFLAWRSQNLLIETPAVRR